MGRILSGSPITTFNDGVQVGIPHIWRSTLSSDVHVQVEGVCLQSHDHVEEGRMGYDAKRNILGGLCCIFPM